MKEIKRGLLRIFFTLETIGFVFMYLFGAQGMQVLWQLHKENLFLEKELLQLHTDVAQLEKEIVNWEHDSFSKEKLAREQLQMARKGDEIYYIN